MHWDLFRCCYLPLLWLAFFPLSFMLLLLFSSSSYHLKFNVCTTAIMSIVCYTIRFIAMASNQIDRYIIWLHSFTRSSVVSMFARCCDSSEGTHSAVAEEIPNCIRFSVCITLHQIAFAPTSSQTELESDNL